MAFDLTIVIPLYNEQDNVQPLFRDLKKALNNITHKTEVICVDDGSSDKTWLALKQYQKRIPHTTLIQLRRNFGQTAALSAGFAQATGAIVATLDADLQNSPDDLPNLLTKLDEGYDVVSGWRVKRQDAVVRVLLSRVANRIISWISGVTIHDFGCTLKVYRREILDELRLYGEMHRFIPAMAVRVGAAIAEVPVQHRPRVHGKSKYGLDRTFRVLLDLVLIKFLLDFQNRPVQLFGGIGLVCTLVGGSVFSWLTYRRLIWLEPLADRPLFLVSIFMVLVGIQLISIGLIAEMLLRIYYESQGKRPYYIRQVVT